MTNPDPPVEIPRPLFSRRTESPATLAAPTAPETREEQFHPRYVQLHALREHGHGSHNLVWGALTLFFALALLVVALFLAGPRALLALGACLVTCTALFVLARLHVFRQRNGGFFALGIVCLFGAAFPLLEMGCGALANFLKNRPAAPIVQATLPAAELQPMSLTEAFALTAPDPKGGPRVKVLKDSRVNIEGKPFLIKAGDLFVLGSKANGEVTLIVRDLLVSLPADAAEVLNDAPVANTGAPAKPVPPARLSLTGRAPRPEAAEPVLEAPAPADETPAQVTARSHREAMRRYPALGVKDSLENQMFVSFYRELKANGGDDFFTDPEWPLAVAEMLAKREKWVRGAPPITVSAGPAAVAAEEEEPAAPEIPPPANQ